jgi:tetratricopeptide (TPR) repeat protein
MTSQISNWILVVVVSFDSVAFALTEEELREGDWLVEAGQYQQAEALYRAALEKDANDVQARRRLVNVLMAEDKVAEAAHLVQQDDSVLAWARSSENPRAVLRAAFAISGPDQPNNVLFSASVGWAEADAQAAQDWILSLPVGVARDWALAGMARGMANVGQTVTPTALGAFSNERTRQERLLFVIPTLARHNAPEARALIDTYITEPDIRERVEQAYHTALTLPPP